MATIRGTARRNTLNGTSSSDSIFGLGGDDLLRGGNGNDRLRGGEGNDKLNGGRGADRLFGENGNDRLGGDQGNDSLDGGEGNDTLIGGTGNDSMTGGNGDDVFLAGAGADAMDGGANNATQLFTEFIFTGAIGGDWLSYADSTTRVGVSLGSGSGGSDGALGDTWSGMENLRGSDFDDGLVANGALAASAVFGGRGNDTIFSDGFVGTGAAIMRGDEGDDILWGSAPHQDVFVLQYGKGLDSLVQFDRAGGDFLALSAAEFNLATPAASNINATEIMVLTAPIFITADVRLIYDTDTGIIWSDKDGSGSAFSAVAIAVLDDATTGAPPATLLTADFFIFA